MSRRKKLETIETPVIDAVEKSGPTGFAEPFIGGFTDLAGLAYANGFYPSETGVPVGPISALGVSACYAAVKALSEDIGVLPLILHERLRNGDSMPVINHPILDILEEPNSWMTREELITYLSYCLVFNGNAYCFIQRNFDGSIRQLIPASPYQVQVLIDQQGSGDLFYTFVQPMYPNEIFMCGQENMIHIKNSITTPGGIFGYSPIELGKQVLGNAIATQRTANVFFANGAMLRGVIEASGRLSPEAKKSLKDGWSSTYESAHNSHKTAILEEGMKFTPIVGNNAESQLLESRKFSVEEIARWFRIPTVKIGEMGRANFSNVVELNTAYITDCLIPICSKIENALLRRLFIERSDRKRYFFRFSFEDKLRGKELEQMQALQIGRMTGIITQNEARAKLKKNPVPGGDTFLSPMNMTITGKPDGSTDMTIQVDPSPDAQPSPDVDENQDE